MIKSPKQAKMSGLLLRSLLVMSIGIAVTMHTGTAIAEDAQSTKLVKISKDNINTKLAAEFQKYLQTGSPDAMCEFGMEEHGTAFTAQSSPKIIGVSKSPQLAHNKNLSWQVFSQSAIVTEKSNFAK